MPSHEFSRFRRILESLAQRVRADAAETRQESLASGMGQAAGELSDMPTHLADRGTDEFLSEMNAALLENEQYLADEVRAALERIDAGSFGQCENCGQPISNDRLEAIPYARFCIRCAEQNSAPQPNLNGE